MSTMTEPERPVAEPAPNQGPPPATKGPTFDTLAVLAFAIALIAIVIAIFAVGIAVRSIDEHRATPAGGSTSPASAAVVLEEFKITPAPLHVSAGSSLSVTNDGATIHDLAVEGQDAKTPELNPGEEAELDLAALQPGAYTVYCQIAGHREAGMEGDLTIG